MGPFWSVSVGGRAWERGAGGGGACLTYTEVDAYWLEIRGIERLRVIFIISPNVAS